MPPKPKKFLGRHEADRRAVALVQALRKIEAMPLIGVEIRDGPQPILVWEKRDPAFCERLSVDLVLRLDIDKAVEAGGTLQHLIWTRKAKPRPALPQGEIDRAYEAFVTGEEEEDPPE